MLTETMNAHCGKLYNNCRGVRNFEMKHFGSTIYNENPVPVCHCPVIPKYAHGAQTLLKHENFSGRSQQPFWIGNYFHLSKMYGTLYFKKNYPFPLHTDTVIVCTKVKSNCNTQIEFNIP